MQTSPLLKFEFVLLSPGFVPFSNYLMLHRSLVTPSFPFLKLTRLGILVGESFERRSFICLSCVRERQSLEKVGMETPRHLPRKTCESRPFENSSK